MAPLISPRDGDTGSAENRSKKEEPESEKKKAAAESLPPISPRQTKQSKAVTNDALPLLHKPGFHTPKVSPRGEKPNAVPSTGTLGSNVGSEMDDAALAALLGNDDPNSVTTPAALKLLAQAQQITSPDNDMVDDHINQFLDDMQSR